MTALCAAFRDQAGHCGRLGSPFMERLMGLLAAHWPQGGALDRAFAGYDGDIGPGGHSLPLRLAGGLHALVLRGDADLGAVYPPHFVRDATLIRTVLDALERHAAFLVEWTRRPPQTNDVRRSGPLIAAAHWIAARHPLPFFTSELGASAGLNLNWDRFALETGQTRLGPDDAALCLTPEWRGPEPQAARIRVTDKAGVDLTPLDARKPEDALRLAAYLWPDQPERMALTRAAIATLDRKVVQADAIDWLATRLAEQPDGHVHLVYHTIAWQYFPAAAQARGASMMAEAGARATADRPLAWLGLEGDGATPGAALSLKLWPGGLQIALGRADYHGRWIEWAGT